MKLWLMGEILPRWSENGWALVGIFETEESAVAAAPNSEGIFVAPIEAGEVHAGMVNSDGILMDTLYPGDEWPGLRWLEVNKS